MKRDLSLLPPFPNGWFRVCESEDLQVGEVKPVHFFGEDFVVFRTESGQAQVLDAYCPHLGAHLGHGGEIVGDTIRCPFHHWSFDGNGRCTSVPYAKRIPKRACIRHYPVCEVNDIVFVWWHDEGIEPTHEIPVLEEWGHPDWTTPVKKQFTLKAHPQDMAENLADVAHFKYVHGNDTVPPATASVDDHVFKVKLDLTYTTPRGDVPGYVDVNAFGLGFGRTRFSGIVDTFVVITGTVVDENLQEIVIRFSVKKMGDEGAEKAVEKAFTDEVTRQFIEDRPIWENKTYWERPVLCDGDGPINLLRKYCRQFYPSQQQVISQAG